MGLEIAAGGDIIRKLTGALNEAEFKENCRDQFADWEISIRLSARLK